MSNTQNDNADRRLAPVAGSAVTALAELAQLSRPVFYRGKNVCGHHLFSDCSPMVTHVFATINEAITAFHGRNIRNLPNDQIQP